MYNFARHYAEIRVFIDARWRAPVKVERASAPWMSIFAVMVFLFALLWSVTADAHPDRESDLIVEAPIPGFPHATLFRRAGDGRLPVIVILAGAEGGNDAGQRFGPILARLGYAAVSLPYYSPDWGEYAPPPKLPELPGSFIDIRVEQLAELRESLASTPGVDVNRFGLFGGSKGAEFALIAASHYEWIDAVVAFAPSDLVWEGWGLETVEAPGTRSSFSLDGQPLAFMPYRDLFAALDGGPHASLLPAHENGRADNPDKEQTARILVERYRGQLMLVAGDADRLWNSGRMARNIAASRKAAGLATDTALFADAGHDIAGDSAELRDDPRGGGAPEANARARAEAWPKVIAFLADSLRP